MEVKIKLKVKDVEVELDLEEMKELNKILNDLLATKEVTKIVKEIEYIPSYPIYPYPSYPQVTWYDKTTSDITWIYYLS